MVSADNLAKKDIFGASDPYVRIDLVTNNGDEVIDSVLTKTKKRTLNPKWEEEFMFRVKPNDHKLVLEVFDENRLTRDDFLGRPRPLPVPGHGLNVFPAGRVDLPLAALPREYDGRSINNKYYILQPRSARSKVRGHLQVYHAYVKENNEDTASIAPESQDSVPPQPGETLSSVKTRLTVTIF